MADKIKVRVERDYNGNMTMGRMLNGTWNYSVIPEQVSRMKIAFETWFAQMMKKHQPGVEYEIEYQEGIIGSKGWEV